MEVHEWYNDGHKVLVSLHGEDVHLSVICPGLEHGRQPGLKCGMGTDEPTQVRYCHVTEMVNEYGLETHVSGLTIMVRGEVPIEWGYFGGEGEEFFFKCAGYPSWDECKGFREEAFADLFEQETFARATTLAKAVGLYPVRPWSEVDEEYKDQIREDISIYIENEERKKTNA